MLVLMAYAKRRIWDADSHIMETPDWLASHADPGIRERLNPLTSNAVELVEHLDEAIELHDKRGTDAELVAVAEDRVLLDKGWLGLGAFDPAERSRALDLLGFERQMVFSTFCLGQFFLSKDIEVVYGGTTAHNRGMAEFCAEDERLVGVGYVPLVDGERAAAATTEAIELGCQAIHVKSAPSGDLSPTHRDFNGVWQRCVDANVPVVLHLGGGVAPNGRRPLPEAFENNGRPAGTGFLGGEGMRALDYMSTPHPVETFVAAMALDGVFEQLPDLRLGVIEQGAMWLVPFLRRIDIAQQVFKKGQPYLDLPMRASEYVRRQVKATPFPREPVGWLVEQTGEDMIMFSSDYPHPEGGKDPIALWSDTFGDLSDDAIDAFYWRNMAGFLAASVAA